MKSNQIILLLIPIITCCSTPNFIDQGKVEPSNFYAKTTFITAKSLILIPCEIDGLKKNFLFDTGATVTTVQRDSIFGKIISVHGASNRTVENGSETIKSFKISTVNFVNTFATNENLRTLKDSIPNFGGILGRSIINKANWLIDYPNKTLEISNKNLSNDTFEDILLDNSTNAPYTFVEIDKRKFRAIIDLGSTSIFNVPEESELAKQLLQTYKFKKNERQRYTVGGLESITELIGVIPILRIGDLEFKDVEVNINQSSQIRLGMKFFKESIIYIDNTNRKYSIKQVN